MGINSAQDCRRTLSPVTILSQYIQFSLSSTAEMFSAEIEKKLMDFPAVYPRGVTADSDPFDTIEGYQPARPGSVQAVPILGSKEEGYSPVYRNVLSQEALVTGYHPSIKTYYDAVHAAADRFPTRDFLGNRVYDPVAKKWSEHFQYISYQKAMSVALQLGAGISYSVKKKTERPVTEKYIVAFYMPNCPEWILADIATQTQSLPNVCLYDTLGPGTSEYILNLCECPVVISSLGNARLLLTLKSRLPKLGVIVVSESLNGPYERPGDNLFSTLKTWAKSVNVDIYGWDEVLEMGVLNNTTARPPSGDDIYAISFTSGTTGVPKGAILRQKEMAASIFSTRSMLPVDDLQTSQKHSFCYLPLAHVFERGISCAYISLGYRISFPHGSVKTLFEDLAIAQPTHFNMVPRVLNRLAGMIRANTVDSDGIAGLLGGKAFDGKYNRLKSTGSANHPLWDPLWSNKIRESMGFSNLCYIFTGAAPIAPETVDFLKCALGCEVLQGYGATETMGAFGISVPGEKIPGDIGGPSVAWEFKLRDVSGLNYLSSDRPHPRGELLVRGTHMFKGYYKNHEKTNEAFDDKGWFLTGDVVSVDELGRVRIIDRVKNFFKLAQGEYIGAEKIENAYMANATLINQIFVHGSSHESFLVAICAVNPTSFARWASELLGRHIPESNTATIDVVCQDTNVRKAFLAELNKSIQPGVLQGFERVKNTIMGVEPMTAENGCLTPTLKIIRSGAVKVYKHAFDNMYKEGPLDAPTVQARL